MPSLQPNRWRQALVIVLLCATLVSAVLLAVEAQLAVRGHRATMESVLRDDAALAAQEYVRRCASAVGYEGIYRQLTRLGDMPPAGGAGLVGPLLERDGAALRLGGVEPPEPLKTRLSAQRNAAPGGGRTFWAFHTVVDGAPRSFVFLAEPVPRKAGLPVVGFEIRSAALTPFFERAFVNRALLPKSLMKEKEPAPNSFLGITVRDQAGGTRFSSRPLFPNGIVVREPFADAYEGILSGFVVDLALDRDAAGSLVRGGLPRSPLPWLLVLLGLCGGFTATAVLQLRRENALNRLREEFVANVSHELRTPLTQIRVFAETLLLARTRSEEEAERSLKIIDREARRLSQLVENILLFSRASRGVLTVSLEERRLAPMVREVAEGFAPIAEARSVRLRLDLDETAAAAVDPDAVRQILLNVLDNSVKYGPSGQQVSVALRRSAAAAQIVVDDEGPGIAPPDRERVFRRFERLARDRSSAVPGSGIGLAVVADLVERMGGRCFLAARDAPASGTRFVAEFPAAAQAVP